MGFMRRINTFINQLNAKFLEESTVQISVATIKNIFCFESLLGWRPFWWLSWGKNIFNTPEIIKNAQHEVKTININTCCLFERGGLALEHICGHLNTGFNNFKYVKLIVGNTKLISGNHFSIILMLTLKFVDLTAFHFQEHVL